MLSPRPREICEVGWSGLGGEEGVGFGEGCGAPLAWVQGEVYGEGMVTRRGFDEEVVRAALDEIARLAFLPRLYPQLYRVNPMLGQIWEGSDA